MKIARSLLGFSLLVGAFLAPSRAEAQPRPAENGTAPNADEWFAKGNAAFDAGRYEEAAAAYAKAWDARRSVGIGGNYGTALMKLGRMVEAAEIFEAARSLTQVDSERGAFDKLLAEALPHVCAVRVTVDIQGARVLVDGAEKGFAPALSRVFVDAGEHTIEARHDGYPSASSKITGVRGAALDVALTLRPKELPAPPATGPEPAIYLLGGGLALASLATGIGLRVAASGEASKADDAGGPLGPGACVSPSTACDEVESHLKQEDAFRNASTGLFVTGGVLTAATLIYVGVAAAAGGAPSAAAVPWISPREVGVTYFRNF